MNKVKTPSRSRTSVTASTKPPAAKVPAPAATSVAAKTSARKKPVRSATNKTATQSRPSNVANKDAVDVNPRTNNEIRGNKPAPRKPKLIRDSFTFPEPDYAMFKVLKKRALETGTKVKKSELLRAGMAALALMSNTELAKALAGIERIKASDAKKK